MIISDNYFEKKLILLLFNLVQCLSQVPFGRHQFVDTGMKDHTGYYSCCIGNGSYPIGIFLIYIGSISYSQEDGERAPDD
jgi:hypothetical protein